MKKKSNGITLVALVITIILLLILAGISISALTNTGIFGKAKEAKDASENAEKEQKQTLSEYEKELNKYTAQELTNDKVNKVLSETTGAESAYSGDYVEEDTNDSSTLKNIDGKSIAKNITNFINSVKANGGYYIGRYEARTTTARNDKGNALTQITEKGTDQVYNYVTQQQAAEQAQVMYTSNDFTSDLMNSYAWDTAITFIQKCTDKTNYANQTSLNKSLSQTGTTNDNPCNIFDMSSNVGEFTTETSSYSDFSCVHRGGDCIVSNNYTSYRGDTGLSDSSNIIGFRPLLYL